MRQTHTYVVLEISDAAYREISAKLKDAGYGHAFNKNGEIDMHGIAVQSERAEFDTSQSPEADGGNKERVSV